MSTRCRICSEWWKTPNGRDVHFMRMHKGLPIRKIRGKSRPSTNGTGAASMHTTVPGGEQLDARIERILMGYLTLQQARDELEKLLAK